MLPRIKMILEQFVLDGNVGKCSAKCASQSEVEELREELQHLKMAFAS